MKLKIVFNYRFFSLYVKYKKTIYLLGVVANKLKILESYTFMEYTQSLLQPIILPGTFMNPFNEQLKKILCIIKGAALSFIHNGCFNMAAATAFYAILSTIPLIFVLVAGTGFFFEGSQQIIETIVHAVDTVLPSYGESLKKEIYAVVRKKELIGGVGLIIMLWSSTLIFSSLEFAFSRIFNVEKRRSFLRSKIVNMGLVIIGILALTASVLLTTVAKFAQSRFVVLHDNWVTDFFSSSIFVQYILPIMILTLLFTIFYTVLSRHTVSITNGLTGGLICAVLFEGAKYLFAWYIANLGRHSLIYGSLGAMIVIILWFFYAAIIILFCGELIAAWRQRDEKVVINGHL